MANTKARKKVETKTLPRSYVTFLLDRSGSMDSIKPQTIEGFNTYLTTLQEEKEAEILFTFLQFDTGHLDKVYVAAPIKNVPLLTNATYQPRGGTPLIDASYSTIKAVEEAVARETVKPRVVICIQTDGYENASQEHTWQQLSALVKAKQEEGWQFNFMGAGIDGFRQAAQMGIAAQNTVSYDSADMAATKASFHSSSSNAAGFASARAESTSYTVGQRASAGEHKVTGRTK